MSGSESATRDFASYLRRHGYAVETQRHRLGIVHRWLAWIGPRWTAATFRDVEAWAGTLGIKPASQRAHLSHLSAFYRWAGRDGQVAANPVELVDLPASRGVCPARPMTWRLPP